MSLRKGENEKESRENFAVAERDLLLLDKAGAVFGRGQYFKFLGRDLKSIIHYFLKF